MFVTGSLGFDAESNIPAPPRGWLVAMTYVPLLSPNASFVKEFRCLDLDVWPKSRITAILHFWISVFEKGHCTCKSSIFLTRLTFTWMTLQIKNKQTISQSGLNKISRMSCQLKCMQMLKIQRKEHKPETRSIPLRLVFNSLVSVSAPCI